MGGHHVHAFMHSAVDIGLAAQCILCCPGPVWLRPGQHGVPHPLRVASWNGSLCNCVGVCKFGCVCVSVCVPVCVVFAQSLYQDGDAGTVGGLGKSQPLGSLGTLGSVRTLRK